MAINVMEASFDFTTTLYLWFVYTLYVLCWSLLVVFTSAKVKLVGNAIATLLLLWMVMCVLLPRISANIAENLYAQVTNYEFKSKVAADIEQGLNGHDSQSDRAKRIEAELLAKYKVDSVQKLPFNFEGFIMQQGEEYSSQVYDVHFARLFESLKNQKAAQSWFALGSPFIAVRNISMAASNASLESEIDFQVQAEAYRRDFVQKLNNDMMNNSAYGSFNNYKVKDKTYEAIKDLEVASRSLAWSLQNVVKDNAMLFLWVLTMLGLTLFISGKEVYR
jgi:ABC-2 type transport system permease protein